MFGIMLTDISNNQYVYDYSKFDHLDLVIIPQGIGIVGTISQYDFFMPEQISNISVCGHTYTNKDYFIKNRREDSAIAISIIPAK